MPREFVNHPLLKKKKVEARLYQQLIFAQAMKQNTLVILPTGLGKTVIFILLAAAKLQLEPAKQVIITAPFKPLVEQHASTLRDVFTLPEESIVSLTGDISTDKRKEYWENAWIISITPQTLRNDIIAGRVDLSRVSLLCFDEAHRAVGDYPYPMIAKQYRKQAENGLILAMTASPGSKEKVLEVVENLFIEHIEARDENSPDVKPYIHPIEEEPIMVHLPEKMLQVKDRLEELQTGFLKTLKDGGFTSSYVPKNNSKQFLLELPGKIREAYEKLGEEKRNEMFSYIQAAWAAVKIAYAHEMLETQGVPAVKKYLEKLEATSKEKGAAAYLQRLVRSKEFKEIKRLIDELANEGVIHPKYEKLKEVLNDFFSFSHDGKVLVFANYRDSVETLAKGINNPPIIRAHWFVGKGARKSVRNTVKLSKKEQQKVLEMFRMGEYNVLVSTSVGEEGLDIDQTDMVIFYDIVPSATRSIQRKGRTGRKRKGKVVYLITENTRDQGYYYASKARKRKVDDAISEFQEMNSLISINKQQSLDSFTIETHEELKKNIGGIEKDENLGTAKRNEEDEESQLNKHDMKSHERHGMKVKEERDLHDYEKQVLEGSLEEFLKDNTQEEETITQTLETNDKNVNVHASSPSFPERVKAKTRKLIVYVDPLEKTSTVIDKLLDKEDIELKFMTKEEVGNYADYVVSDRVGIQRKNLKDFVQSMKKAGRENIFHVLKGLKQQYSKPVFILEGRGKYATGIAPTAIRGFISSLWVKYGITTILSNDEADTAAFIYALARQEQWVNARSIHLSTVRAGFEWNEVLVSMLSQVPGLEMTLARRLLREYKSLQVIMELDVKDLMKVKGIGVKTAKRIKEAFSRKYDEDYP